VGRSPPPRKSSLESHSSTAFSQSSPMPSSSAVGLARGGKGGGFDGGLVRGRAGGGGGLARATPWGGGGGGVGAGPPCRGGGGRAGGADGMARATPWGGRVGGLAAGPPFAGGGGHGGLPGFLGSSAITSTRAHAAARAGRQRPPGATPPSPRPVH